MSREPDKPHRENGSQSGGLIGDGTSQGRVRTREGGTLGNLECVLIVNQEDDGKAHCGGVTGDLFQRRVQSRQLSIVTRTSTQRDGPLGNDSVPTKAQLLDQETSSRKARVTQARSIGGHDQAGSLSLEKGVNKLYLLLTLRTLTLSLRVVPPKVRLGAEEPPRNAPGSLNRGGGRRRIRKMLGSPPHSRGVEEEAKGGFSSVTNAFEPKILRRGS